MSQPSDIMPAQANCLARMNAKYAVVRDGGRTRVISEEFDPALQRPYLAYYEFADIAKFHHKPLQLDQKNWTTEGAWWLRHSERRQYDGVTFVPGEDVPGFYNLWRGWAVEPRQGDWDLLQEHLFEIICRATAALFLYVMAWMADAVQRPRGRPEVAIVLQSVERGTGKGILVRFFLSLFGRHGLQVASARQVLGNFNAHLEDAIVLFLDEALWAGDRAAEGVLKMLITEPKIPIERKYCDVRIAENHLHLILASNNEWVIPAGMDERRFLVLDVDPKRKQDLDYFGRIVKQMESGGRAAMLYDLLHYDYADVDLRRAPRTDALLEQKILSFDPRTRWWFNKLVAGHLLTNDQGWVAEVSKAELHDDYVQELKQTGVSRARTETELGMWLQKMLGARLTTTRPTIGDRRVKRWCFPPLQECRELFDRTTDSKFDWPAPEPARSRSAVSPMPWAPR